MLYSGGRIGRRVLMLVVLFVFSCLIFGCASPHYLTKEEVNNNPSVSLVFGYIDTSDVSDKFIQLYMKRLAPPPKPGGGYYWMFGVDKGCYYHMGLPPGKYMLDKIELYKKAPFPLSLFTSPTFRSIEFMNPDSAFVVEKPGMRFLGSLKLRKISGEYSLELVEKPGGVEVLEMMMNSKIGSHLRGTKWEPMIEKKLKKRVKRK